jgi:serine/threonine protein kinase
MIAAASSAGRIQHANIVGVYDAVDEGERAFVVREWVEGKTLTETIRVDGPFDPYRAAALARAAADAIAAIHATGMAHGRLTPNTVLLNEEGEPNFIDLELSESGEVQADIRAIGGLLYASLTGAWPLEASVDFTDLPEAARVDGQLCSPRQLRAGIPGYLDALAMDLLDSSIDHSDAATLAQELRRYDIADPDLGPLTTIAASPAPRPAAWKRFGIPIAGIVCILAAGLAVGTMGLPDIGSSNYPLSGNSDGGGSSQKTALRPVSATILDPQGDGTEVAGAQKTIDNNADSAWSPDAYHRANFGGIKSGMGVVVDLGKSTKVKQVVVNLSAPGTSLELRGSQARGTAIDSYQALGQPAQSAPAEVSFVLPHAVNVRYLVLWITELPRTAAGPNPYQVGVRDIKVYGD